jgi:hypothetical protein
MPSSLAGRPVQTYYAKGTCQLTYRVPVTLKRALAESAERSGRLFRDEILLALETWVGDEPEEERHSVT